MIVNAIKLKDGTYWAGCNKKESKTLLGAQLYKSEKTALNVMKNSINFHHKKEDCSIVSVILEERED